VVLRRLRQRVAVDRHRGENLPIADGAVIGSVTVQPLPQASTRRFGSLIFVLL
jgi:hypothetical protein